MAKTLSRVVVLTTTLMAAGAPLPMHALGLGSIETRSALNQPFEARIDLVSLGAVDPDVISVSLASKEDFRRTGVDRPFHLGRLKFSVAEGEDGRPHIVVTSDQPIREPFLNFLVEVDWPSGRMLRQYTVLLDPPTYMADSEPKAEADRGAVSAAEEPERPSRTARPDPDAAPPAAPSPDTESRRADTGAPAAPSRPQAPSSHHVRENDTLWSLAKRFRPEGVSVHQMMLALYRTNPHAFYEDNLNALESGRILRIPDDERVASISESEALDLARQHGQQWQEYREQLASAATPQAGAGQGAGSGEAADDTAVADAAASDSDADAADGASQGQIEVVAAEDDGTATGAGTDAGDGAADDEELALAREELAAKTRKNEELHGRVESLESQVQKMQRLLSLKNDELASLQERLQDPDGGDGEAGDAEATEPPEMEDDVATVPAGGDAGDPDAGARGDGDDAPSGEAPGGEPAADEPDAGAQDDGGDASAGEASDGEEPAADGETSAEQTGAEAAGSGAGEDAEGSAQSDGDAPQQLAQADAPGGSPGAGGAGSQSSAPSPETSGPMGVVDRALGALSGVVGSVRPNPQVMGLAAAGVLLLGALGWLMVRRRRMQGEGFQESILQDRPGSEMTAAGGAPAAGKTHEESSFLSDFAVSDIGAIETKDVNEADPLSEADVYLAYGRYQQAEELLRDAIGDHGDRADLRVKLVEVHHAAGNRDGLIQEAQALQALVGESDPAWARAAELGRELAPEHPLFGGSGAGDTDKAAAADDDLDLPDLEDMNLGAEPAVEDTGPSRPDASADELLSGADLSDEHGSGAAAEGGEAAGSQTPSDEPLEFDLSDMDLPGQGGSGESERAAGEAAAGTDADQRLDFDLGGLGTGEEAPDETRAPGGGEADLGAGLEFEGGAVESGGESDAGGSAGEAGGEAFGELDEVGTKLDLARAYIDMGDQDGARSILDEVIDEGSDEQQREAQELKQQLS